MLLDAATLQDLEIVPTPATRSATVWSLIDRTRTRAGRTVLRERMTRSSHTAEDILALQRAHRALAHDASGYRTILDRADLDGVEAYLTAMWQLPSHMPPAIRVRKWYHQYVQDVEVGQARIRGFLAAATELGQRLSTFDAPMLKDLSDAIVALLEKPLVPELMRLTSSQSPTTIRAFDELARERAKPLLLDLVRYVGRVEALWSVGAATQEHGWCYPRPATQLRVRDLTHPLLGSKGVANDLLLRDEARVCFITGPNMAGKSTFMKAIAVAVVLAHIGSGVPATSMDFPIVGTVFSSVNVEDSLAADESFYLAEVRRIKALAAALASHGSGVAVIDEPFRGTNVHDAAEATVAVITRLAAHPGVLVLVASHLGEIAPAISGDPRIELLHFAADATSHPLRFDYRIREGVSVQRLGMTLLEQEGVLDLLEHCSIPADAVANSVPEPPSRA